MGYEYDIFISYRKKEPPKDWVFEYFYKYFEKELQLQVHKARIYIDEKQMRGGQEWEPSLIEALGKSRIIVPVFSPSYFEEECWAIKEAAYMYGRHKEYCHNSSISPIMPVVLGGDFSQDYNCSVHSYDFTSTRALPSTKKKSDLNKLLFQIEHLVKDIKENRTKLPQWNENFINPDFFATSMSHIQDIRKFYKPSNDFDTFSNPVQIIS